MSVAAAALVAFRIDDANFDPESFKSGSRPKFKAPQAGG
jgi:hypothetical protein